MDKDDLLIKRIQDLASLADRRGCVTYTDFLNLNEQNILQQTIQKFSWVQRETFGGYEGAERQIAAFIPDIESESWNDVRFLSSDHPDNHSASSAENTDMDVDNNALAVSPSGLTYPIHCIHILPRTPKFAETLSHRDILGALMHLGIDRAKTGDIAVTEKEAWLFCSSRLSGLISQELTQVRHTQVRCERCNLKHFTYTPEVQTIRGSISSVRLDALMALGFGASRSSLLPQIESGNVYVNGKLITTNAYSPKEGDIISVRHMGRFRYIGVDGQSRKGRIFAEIEKFV